MATDQEIEDLLREDEAELRAKRKRLKAFSTSVEEARKAQKTASILAVELVDAGDLTRSDIARVFKLTRAEKAVLVPARHKSGSDAEPENADSAGANSNQPEQGNEQAE